MKLLLGAAFAALVGLTVADGCSGTKSLCSIVLASDYDQSCVVDTDCVAVSEVPSCPIDSCEGCPLATINVDGMAKYMTAFSRACASLPPSFGNAGVNCGAVGPCCRGGKCTAASVCLSPKDTLAACVDAGGSCARVGSDTSCVDSGPPDGCAFSDEFCCVGGGLNLAPYHVTDGGPMLEAGGDAILE